MGITINIAMVDIKVSKQGHDFNEREQKILEVLMLNLAAHANAQVTGEGMAFHPKEKREDDIFSFQFAWQKSIEKQQYEELVAAIQSRYETAFKMSGLEDIHIDFLENSYLKK
ncbi:hypothetical protein [Ornithinibacillus californiensis]|uniref:hypothetical protein n=1 Tax=Ornithinibacillus californiensis TaxID=161536 RepID=UPI0012EE0FC3|nr:hypothetical protein [Ornithinibacillus californiensis]